MYLFALRGLFYISIVFGFDGFRFHPFFYWISKKWNAQGADLKQWNENLNSELTGLIINELHTFL